MCPTGFLMLVLTGFLMLVLRPYIVMLQSGHSISLAFWWIDCFAKPLCSPSLTVHAASWEGSFPSLQQSFSLVHVLSDDIIKEQLFLSMDSS